MENNQYSYLAEVRRRVDAADAAYYRPGFKPIMTDSEYTVLKNDLRTLAPDDHRHSRVGVPYSAAEIGTKRPHKMVMGSLDNTDNGILGLEEWYTKVATKLHQTTPALRLMPKMDGVSVGAIYERVDATHSRLVAVISRGDGVVGEDITANAIHFRWLPSTLPLGIDCTVRGEAVLHKTDFLHITQGRAVDEKTNPRNLCNGIVGKSTGEFADLVCFYAFNIEAEGVNFQTSGEKLNFIQSLGFTPVDGYLCPTTADVEAIYAHMLTRRESLDYVIDGLVVELESVCDQKLFLTKDSKSRLRPKYARAIKFPEYFSQTIVTGVTVSVGHTASIIPTAQLQPVWIGGEHQGVTVQNALLTNFDEVLRLDVAVGDTVEVALAGDIIPKVIRVLVRPEHRTPIVEPTRCPSCGDATTRQNRGKAGANLYCSNEECPGVLVGKIHHWIGNSKKGVGILDIGDAMERALYEQRLIQDPSDLYRLTPDMIETVLLNGKTRIGRSRAEKAVANIQGKKAIPLNVFLGSLGIDLLGRRRVVLLAGAAEGQLNSLEDWLDDHKLSTIQVPGLGPEIRTAIRAGLTRCKPLISRLLQVGVIALPLEPENVDHNPTPDGSSSESLPVADKSRGGLVGLNFVFTGTRECIGAVKANGGNVQDGVRKDTHYLVQKFFDSQSTKAKKAAAAGVKVITLDTLKDVLNGTAQLP